MPSRSFSPCSPSVGVEIESVAQHFYMTLKSGIHYIVYVCSFLGSHKSVAESVTYHSQSVAESVAQHLQYQ